MTPAVAIASLLGIGRLRPAPGSWGSAAVLPCALLGPWPCLVLALIATLLGFWALRRLPAEAAADPGWVVIDEAAGQLIALAAVPQPASLAGVLAAFLLFRAFDIAKPGPIGWADRQPGATGVMMDDVVAGAFAALVLVLAALVFPEVWR